MCAVDPTGLTGASSRMLENAVAEISTPPMKMPFAWENTV